MLGPDTIERLNGEEAPQRGQRPSLITSASCEIAPYLSWGERSGARSPGDRRCDRAAQMYAIDIGNIPGILGVMLDPSPSEHLILSDVDAHDHVMGLSINEVVRELADYLGATTVAVIAGVSETRAVAQWMSANGREPQRPHVLRFALQITTMIASQRDSELARAWFHGSNPRLGDASPMLLLRERPLAEVQAAITAAARAFASREQGLQPT